MNMNFKKNVHVQDMFTHCYPIYLMSKSICSLFYELKKGNVVFYFHYMFLCIHQYPLLIVDELSIKDPHSFQKCFFFMVSMTEFNDIDLSNQTLSFI